MPLRMFFFFGRILRQGVIHARLRLLKNSLLVWTILLLGKEHITPNTSFVLNAEIHFCPLQCPFQILKVKSFISAFIAHKFTFIFIYFRRSCVEW